MHLSVGIKGVPHHACSFPRNLYAQAEVSIMMEVVRSTVFLGINVFDLCDVCFLPYDTDFFPRLILFRITERFLPFLL